MVVLAGFERGEGGGSDKTPHPPLSGDRSHSVVAEGDVVQRGSATLRQGVVLRQLVEHARAASLGRTRLIDGRLGSGLREGRLQWHGLQ